MLIAETEVQAPYRSVRHALRSAFEAEARDVIKRPMLLGSRSLSMQSDLTPWDRAAQGAIVISLLHENCRLDVIRAVTALYMPIDAGTPRGRLLSKARAIHDLVWHVASYPHLSGYDREYLRDVICEWGDAPRTMTQPQWMKKLRVCSKTLERIRFGNSQRGRPGVMQILDDLVDEAAWVLGEVFGERGLVGRE